MRFKGKIGAAAGILGLWLTALPALAAQGPQPAYIGVEMCGMCHKRDATGNQLAHWQQSKHAKAYATLATPEAKTIAEAKGIADPQKDGKCLKCHVTAHGVDPARIVGAKGPTKKGFEIADGVQCETCHGPGSLYKDMKTMQSREASLAKGLIIPDEKTCTQCHNQESPNFKGFNYQEMLKKIQHPNPQKAAQQKG